MSDIILYITKLNRGLSFQFCKFIIYYYDLHLIQLSRRPLHLLTGQCSNINLFIDCKVINIKKVINIECRICSCYCLVRYDVSAFNIVLGQMFSFQESQYLGEREFFR